MSNTNKIDFASDFQIKFVQYMTGLCFVLLGLTVQTAKVQDINSYSAAAEILGFLMLLWACVLFLQYFRFQYELFSHNSKSELFHKELIEFKDSPETIRMLKNRHNELELHLRSLEKQQKIRLNAGPLVLIIGLSVIALSRLVFGPIGL
jgi:hypothetical protein